MCNLFNYFNKNGFRLHKISQFSTIILNKNTHKIIILGIYIFGALSLILLKCQKSRFRWGRCSAPISNMQKKWKNSIGKFTFTQNEKIRWKTRWVSGVIFGRCDLHNGHIDYRNMVGAASQYTQYLFLSGKFFGSRVRHYMYPLDFKKHLHYLKKL